MQVRYMGNKADAGEVAQALVFIISLWVLFRARLGPYRDIM